MLDLHIHTNFSSDGMYSPRQIFEIAKVKGIKALSFADHNEVAANHEGEKLSGKFGIYYVTGTELNSYYDGKDIHILGYFLDYKSAGIEKFLEHVKSKKDEQTHQRYAKLKDLGFMLEIEDVAAAAGGKPATGVSFLKALLKNQKNIKDERLEPYISGAKSRSPFMHFYNDFFKPGCPAFVEIKDVPSGEVIDVILKACGIPVIAHPKDLTKEDIIKLKEFGAKGIEVYTSYHDDERRSFYRGLARELCMVITAGSDFHGEEIKKDVKLGEIGGNDMAILDNLKKIYRELYGKEPYSL